MEWLGLHHDSGPIYQTDRFDRYKALIQQLLDEGKAYKCFMSQEELDSIREAQEKAGEKARYPGTWRDRTDHPENAPYVVRFKNPLEGDVVFQDQIAARVPQYPCRPGARISAAAALCRSGFLKPGAVCPRPGLRPGLPRGYLQSEEDGRRSEIPP